MSQATDKMNAIYTKAKSSKGIIIGIICLVIIIIIVISIFVRRNNEYNNLRPVFYTTPTTGKETQTLDAQNIKPLGSVYSFSFHFFIYIKDYNYRYDYEKEVFSKGETDNACPSFYLAPKINNGIIKIKTGNGMMTFILDNIDIRRWCHIAICVRDNEADIYYQGKLHTSGVLGNFCKINNEPLYTGRGGGFSGLIYKLSYTPDFLTPSQVEGFSKVKPPVNESYFTSV